MRKIRSKTKASDDAIRKAALTSKNDGVRSVLLFTLWASKYPLSDKGFPAITKCLRCGEPVIVQSNRCQNCGCSRPTKKSREFNYGTTKSYYDSCSSRAEGSSNDTTGEHWSSHSHRKGDSSYSSTGSYDWPRSPRTESTSYETAGDYRPQISDSRFTGLGGPDNKPAGYGEYNLDDFKAWVEAGEKSFKDVVLEIIETRKSEERMWSSKGRKSEYDDPEIYRRGNITRQSFNKMLNSPDYTPKRRTVYKYVIALHATLREALRLFRAAGYEPLQRDRLDCLIVLCAFKSIYEPSSVNEMFIKCGQEPLFTNR